MKKTSWSKLKARHLSKKKRREILASAVIEAVEITLRALREKKSLSQQVVADAAGMQQSELSRIEHRGDVKLSTLRRVVTAIGGELELVAILDGERVRLSIG